MVLLQGNCVDIVETKFGVIDNPSKEGIEFGLFNDCGDANLKLGFAAKPWLTGSEVSFKWLRISSHDKGMGIYSKKQQYNICFI